MPAPPRKDTSAQEEYNRQKEIETLHRVFNKLDCKGDGKIDEQELSTYLKYLGYKPKKNEVADIIWEVDEDGDGFLVWEEFTTMFMRAREDKKEVEVEGGGTAVKQGWEPRRLYNIVEFMMVDKDGSGSIDVDECMEILYRRYGGNNLEKRTAEFMAMDKPSASYTSGAGAIDDGDNTISFAEYLQGIRKTEDKSHVGFRISQGMVTTTLEEDQKLIEEIAPFYKQSAQTSQRPGSSAKEARGKLNDTAIKMFGSNR